MDSDLILQLIPDPMLWKDIHGKIIGCNQSLIRKSGLTKEDICGNKEIDMPWSNRYIEIYSKYDAEVIRTKKSFVSVKEVLNFSKNKSIIVNTSRIPIISKTNQVIGILVIYSLTESLDSVLKLIFNHLIESLPYYIFWKDKDSVYLGCNHNFASLFGKTVENIIGKTDFDLNFGAGEAEFFRKADQQVMHGKVQVNEEELLKRPDGTDMTVLVSKIPVKNERGDVIGLLGMSTDITPQKRTQQELEKAKIAAEIANTAKSEFIANISHDIRTPITGILGLAQSLHDKATAAEAKIDAQTLISSTNELLTLLNEIIDVAGLESGQLKTKDEDFSLRDLIAHNLDLLRPATKHKNLAISLTTEDSIPDYLHGNRRYLNRVLLNVLSNAVKFTDKGSISLTVTEHKRNDNQIKLKFVIRDTGIGIPKNKQKLIFQHFSRLNPSYQGLYKGSGLGLYSAKQYLHAIRGTIRVTSEEGKGSAFTIIIPFLISEQKPKPKSHFTLSTSETNNHFTTSRSAEYYETSGVTILAVEDSSLAARMLQQTLEKLKCNVEIVTSGEDAITAITKGDYDLVFMDIGLPGIDGFEATKRIRQLDDKFKAHVPIIALTAHISEQMRQRCLEIGMQDMLTKPVMLITMQQALEKYLPTPAHLQADLPQTGRRKDSLLTIDLEDGANIGGGDIVFAKKMLAMFVENLPSDLTQIQTAYKQNDLITVGKLIHKMYGSLCYCGIPKLRNLAKHLQTAIKEQQPQEVDTLVTQLLEEGEEVLRVWRNLKDV